MAYILSVCLHFLFLSYHLRFTQEPFLVGPYLEPSVWLWKLSKVWLEANVTLMTQRGCGGAVSCAPQVLSKYPYHLVNLPVLVVEPKYPEELDFC